MTGARLIGVYLCLFLGVSIPARADVVTDWNLITQNTALAAGPVRPLRLLDFAIVHIAMHDAVQAIQGRFETYSRGITRTSGSEIAAAAKAARDVLVARFPAQTAAIDASYQAYITAHQIAANDPGIAAGAQAAAACLQGRVGDGSNPAPEPMFLGGTGIGQWRPNTTATTPPQPIPMETSWLGTMRPFAVTHQSQFFSGAPPRITSSRYTRDYNEVKALGRNVDSARTPEQTAAAIFFSDNHPLLWQRTLRGITDRYLKDIGDSARMFALVNIAVADSVMTSWQTKTHYNFWRPSTAIQFGEFDGNRSTVGDPAWQPLFANPNYPDYTSGANSVSGAASETLRQFFGTDRVPFTLMGTNSSRDYLSFSDAAIDVIDGRVLMGIHFRFADEAGHDAGRRVSRYVFKYFLRAHNRSDQDMNFLYDADDFLERTGDDGQDDDDAER